MIALLLIWLGLLVALIAFVVGRPRRAGALTLAYFLGMSLIHVPGPVVYALDPNLPNADTSFIGFELAILGFAAFVLGAFVERKNSRAHLESRRPGNRIENAYADHHLNSNSIKMIAIGTVMYFGVMPIVRAVPSAISIIHPFASLLILGLWLRLYATEYFSYGSRTLPTLALALPIMPIATLAAQGIINYGMSWAISTASFLFVIYRKRGRVYASLPVVGFLGLSLFVTYMGERDSLRELIWEQRAGLADRIERIGEMVTTFHLVNIGDSEDQAPIIRRLNQNFFVGSAVQHHETGLSDFAYGATLQPWALIPRVFWPDKPEVGGGRSIVADFTGLLLSASTSWGAGQTLEFYINFGIPGILIGFFGLGFLLMRLDHGLMSAFNTGDVRKMLLFGLPGLTLLQPEGNLLEITVGTVAAILVALTVSLFFQKLESGAFSLELK